jgi:hypothetical protein
MNLEKVKRFLEMAERADRLAMTGYDNIAEEREHVRAMWRDLTPEERTVARDLLDADDVRKAGKLN